MSYIRSNTGGGTGIRPQVMGVEAEMSPSWRALSHTAQAALWASGVPELCAPPGGPEVTLEPFLCWLAQAPFMAHGLGLHARHPGRT